MKKKDLLNLIDQELLDSLFGYCYARTAHSHEAEELCSDIVFALVKAANQEGDIESDYAFIWRVARNVYADFSERKSRRQERFYAGDPEDLFATIADEDDTNDNDRELLQGIYRRIAFLTRAYRDVMVAYYLDGLSVAEIAKREHVSENTIRQRLFSARETIKKGVETMENKKPLNLQNLHLEIIGTGNPANNDPRTVFYHRQFSSHVVWLCRNKAMSAKEISEALGVPMLYVEEELKIQCKGESGKYGMLKKLDNGKYTTNVVLLDAKEIKEFHNVYISRMPLIGKVVADYVQAHKENYLAFPYLNQRVDLNLILWQQVSKMASCFESLVKRKLKENHFSDVKSSNRPFTVFGYENTENKVWGCGWDGIGGFNVCGVSYVNLENIYTSRIKAHFNCGHDISTDGKLQLAIQAIEGLDVSSLSEEDKEVAAKAIECGYLYRDGDTLYTKILVCTKKDRENLFLLNNGLKDLLDEEADLAAKELAALIRKFLPDHLLPDYAFANMLAGIPMFDLLADDLIARGLLIPPEDGIGAEGCWMIVEK